MPSLEEFFYAYEGGANKKKTAGNRELAGEPPIERPRHPAPASDRTNATHQRKTPSDNDHSSALSAERNQLMQAFYLHRDQQSKATTTHAEDAYAAPTTEALRKRLYGGAATAEDASSKAQPDRWREFFNYERPNVSGEDNATTNPAGAADSQWIPDQQLMSDEQHQRFAQRLGEMEAAEDLSMYHQAGGSANAGTELHLRGERWREKVLQEREMLKMDLERNESKEYTFKPQINSHYFRNRTPTRNARRDSSVASGSNSEREPDIGTRLHNIHLNTLIKRTEAKKNLEDTQAKKLHFQPRLVRAQWVERVEPRYLSGARDRTPSNVVTEMLEKERQEYTFTPVTNKRIPPYVSRYLETPAHKRLSAQPRHQSPPRMDYDEYETAQTFHYDANDATMDSFYDTPGATTKQQRPVQRGRGGTPVRKLTVAEQKAFDDRQRRWAEDAERKRLEMEQQNGALTPFKPKISSKSIAIVANPATKRKPITEKPASSKQYCDAYEQESALTFTPKLNRQSEKLAPKWREQTKLSVDTRRQQEAEMYRQSLFAEVQDATFRPAISNSAAEAKGFIRNAIQSEEKFKDFLSMQRARREKDLKPHRRDLDEQEKIACTFEPEVHDAPAYIKDIAYQMSLARQVERSDPVSRNRRSHSEQKSPEKLNFSMEVGRRPRGQ